MRNITLFILLFIPLAFISCADEELSIEYPCIEGEVLGKIRTAGGGLAVALQTPIEGSVHWGDRDNVVEVLNVPVEFTVEGTRIYFSARKAHEGEQGPITSDGDESIELVLYGKRFTDQGCSEL